MKTPLSLRAPRAAFTLIELLAAIGIIALLVALLSPAVSRMRRSAETSQCVSNLRQVHGLWWEDVQNNNFEVPPAFNQIGGTLLGVENNRGWLDQAWMNLTANKTKSVISEKVFGCPTQRKKNKMAANARTYSMNNIVANYYWSGVWNGSTGLPPVGYYKFPQPSKTMLFSDGAYDGNPYNAALNGTSKRPEAIHDGSANICFMDGHVETMKAADIPPAVTATIFDKPLNTPASIFWHGR